MDQGKHLDQAGLQEIIAIRELLNEGKGRTRKYDKDNVVIRTKESSETTRQTLSLSKG
jgi:hypothetical protein